MGYGRVSGLRWVGAFVIRALRAYDDAECVVDGETTTSSASSYVLDALNSWLRSEDMTPGGFFRCPEFVLFISNVVFSCGPSDLPH